MYKFRLRDFPRFVLSFHIFIIISPETILRYKVVPDTLQKKWKEKRANPHYLQIDRSIIISIFHPPRFHKEDRKKIHNSIYVNEFLSTRIEFDRHYRGEKHTKINGFISASLSLPQTRHKRTLFSWNIYKFWKFSDKAFNLMTTINMELVLSKIKTKT